MDKCRHCGKPFVKFPLWEGEGENKKFIWKNLFKMDLITVLWIASVIMMALAYNHDLQAFRHDIAKCEQVIENPYSYCSQMNTYMGQQGLQINLSLIQNEAAS